MALKLLNGDENQNYLLFDNWIIQEKQKTKKPIEKNQKVDTHESIMAEKWFLTLLKVEFFH